MAGEDRAASVVVDHGGPAADAAAAASGIEAVLGLAGDVATAIFGHGKREVEHERPFSHDPNFLESDAHAVPVPHQLGSRASKVALTSLAIARRR